ncbi:MAG: BamA/TamA family outer membrane protein [Myxococcales bacterium]
MAAVIRLLTALLTLLLALLVPGSSEAKLVARGLVLHGASKTKESTVRALTGLKPGEPVDLEVLATAEHGLAQSDLFMSCKVWLDLTPEDAARSIATEEITEVDVHVTLEEKLSYFAVPVGSIGAGDMAIGAAFVEQNLVGRGLQLLAAGQYGESKSFVVAGLRQPLDSFAPVTWSVVALWRLESFRYYQDHRVTFHVPTMVWGGDVKLGWVATPALRLTAGLLYHRVDVYAPGADDPTVSAPAYNPRSGHHVLAQLHLVYDTTIAPLGLREGVRFAMFNELTDGVIGSDFDYYKLEVKLELYGKWLQSWPSLVLRAALIQPTSSRGIPVNENPPDRRVGPARLQQRGVRRRLRGHPAARGAGPGRLGHPGALDRADHQPRAGGLRGCGPRARAQSGRAAGTGGERRSEAVAARRRGSGRPRGHPRGRHPGPEDRPGLRPRRQSPGRHARHRRREPLTIERRRSARAPCRRGRPVCVSIWSRAGVGRSRTFANSNVLTSQELMSCRGTFRAPRMEAGG